MCAVQCREHRLPSFAFICLRDYRPVERQWPQRPEAVRTVSWLAYCKALLRPLMRWCPADYVLGFVQKGIRPKTCPGLQTREFNFALYHYSIGFEKIITADGPKEPSVIA